jgi:FkbM family methyltransferase
MDRRRRLAKVLPRVRRGLGLVAAGDSLRDRVALTAYLAEDLVDHVAGVRRRGTRELRVRLGGLDVVVDRFSSQLGAYLDVWREGEYAIVPGFRAAPGDVVVDGGANVGFFALWQGASVGPTGAVHAFEPNPRAFELLRRNVEANGLSWVHCHQLALTAAGGPVMLTGDRRDSSMLRTSGHGDGVEVASTTLDGFVADHGIERIDVLKLDTEGAEADIIAGGMEVAVPITRRVVIESHRTRDAVTALLVPAGFAVVHDGYRPNTVFYERPS